MSAQAGTGTRRTGSRLPFGLIALVVVPGVGGAARRVELFGGATTLPAKPHVTESPLPLILHIIAALTFAVAGAFQFSPRLRSRCGWVINLAIAERAIRRAGCRSAPACAQVAIS